MLDLWTRLSMPPFQRSPTHSLAFSNLSNATPYQVSSTPSLPPPSYAADLPSQQAISTSSHSNGCSQPVSPSINPAVWRPLVPPLQTSPLSAFLTPAQPSLSTEHLLINTSPPPLVSCHPQPSSTLSQRAVSHPSLPWPTTPLDQAQRSRLYHMEGDEGSSPETEKCK